MILDTNAVSALATADAGLIKLLGNSARLHLPVIVLGEYQFGLLGSHRRTSLQKWLDLLVEENIVLPIDQKTVAYYAEICDASKKKGRPFPPNDMWIAALALQHELPIVSRDAHFDFVKGVKRLAW